MQFKPLKIGGIICWMLALISAFIPPIYGLLLLSVAVAAAWIIPGYLMRKKYNQQNN
jgi:low temperature requirement protein LtrA